MSLSRPPIDRETFPSHILRAVETTAQFVARARRSLGWSQVELAKFLEVTRETVGRWERGEHDMKRRIWARFEARLLRARRGA